jgi:hypothetical protein
VAHFSHESLMENGVHQEVGKLCSRVSCRKPFKGVDYIAGLLDSLVDAKVLTRSQRVWRNEPWTRAS